MVPALQLVAAVLSAAVAAVSWYGGNSFVGATSGIACVALLVAAVASHRRLARGGAQRG